MTKSGAACTFSIEALLKGYKTAYLWTFTFADVPDLSIAARRWSYLAKDLHRRLDFYGVRSFELHPGGHGLHVHFVTPLRYDVNAVRYYSDHHDFGRINVKAIPAVHATYVAKYLQKASRHPSLKGKRLWSCIGFKEGSKVKDIEIDSPLTREIKKISDDDLFRIIGSDCWHVNTSVNPFLAKLVQPDSYYLRNYLKFRIAWVRVNAPLVRLVTVKDPKTGIPSSVQIVPNEINGLMGQYVVFPSRPQTEYKGEVDWERLAIVFENSSNAGSFDPDELAAITTLITLSGRSLR